MRKHLFLPILIILSLRVSYSQNFEFVKTLKGTLADNPADMVISKKGNIYFTGFFNSDTLNIGSCTLYNLSKKNTIFLSKFDTLGNCLWINTIATDSLNNNPTRLAIDTLENIYLAGQFHGQIDVDPSASFHYLNAISNYNNLFVAKYNTNGLFKWAFSINDSMIYARDAHINVDKDQNILLSGTYHKTTDFDPSVNSYTMCPVMQNNLEGFVAKYDTLGEFKWIIPFKAPNYGLTDIYDIELDNSNNIIITGGFSDVVDFDPNSLISFNLSALFSWDYFLAKYNTNGQLIWAFSIKGGYNEWGSKIEINKQNSIYVGGTFRSSNIDFDPDPINTHYLNTNGATDVFIAKYDSTGHMLFTKSIGGINDDYLTSLDKDKDDNFYWIINYWSNAWDCDFTGNTQLINHLDGGDDLIMRTDSLGKVDFSFTIGTPYTDSYSRRINYYNNSIFLFGWYNGVSVDFDPSSNYTSPSFYGGTDITLAKYSFNNIITNKTDIDFGYTFKIFPNPAKNSITISQTEPSFIKYEIYDINGKLISENKIQSILQKVDLSGYAEGMYIVKLIGNQKVEFKKIVVTE